MIDFDDDDDDDEGVVEDPYSGGGYGRPPVAHRFGPGNPGRPRGSRNKPKSLWDEFQRALDKDVAVQGGNTVTVRRAMVAKAVREGLTGGSKDTIKLLQLLLPEEARRERQKKLRPPTLAELLNDEDN